MVNILWILLILVLMTEVPGHAQQGDPLFSFGLIADVQYADVESSGKRDYRGSPKRLEKAIEILNTHDLSFVIHAGDLIDRYFESFEVPLGLFGRSRAPVHFVMGNHEFSVVDSLKDAVRTRVNNPRGYHAFRVKNFQFIILDAMDVSVHSSRGGTRTHDRAIAIREDLKAAGANNAYDWNGALGPKQMKWLRRQLRDAQQGGYRVVLFSHLPLLPENGLHLWNHREVLSLLNSFPSVVAFISGHHHDGGYVKSEHIHHVTLKGLVEASSETACGVADVYPDRIVIRGYGEQNSYVLDFE